MNLTHLRAFHLVASYGSYTAAATAAGVSQPTLSEQVRLLEGKYSQLLLRRAGRSMELTSTGEALLAVTTRLFAAELEAESLLSARLGTLSGRLRFGTDAPIHAVPILSRLRSRHPGIKVELISGNSASIKKAVANGSADIGIVADASPHPLLTTAVLGTQDLVALVRHDSLLAGAKQVSIKALNGQSLIMREPGSVTRSVTQAALADWGVAPGDITETDGREAVQAAVLAGLGIGLIGDGEFSHDPRLLLLDLVEDIAPMTEYVAYRTDRGRDPVIAAALACTAP
ncbi:LysR family transcriptional regulator (plasmid) [Arthrobacter sp. ERGS1:01]|uniref:LysR substrate-binding domain-containing protein n=1 Tax=Arthrobacter sp. ERGS1:01 TaxID=1704044 RepID=UPI0006B57B88|nr:LysR substrate-binding domain-containing protein [Arthrobacter sp. ERGS1:01]ALE04161.1 LysR family transcriptional regulator [Arthrobacter sp. ERGS1:01]